MWIANIQLTHMYTSIGSKTPHENHLKMLQFFLFYTSLSGNIFIWHMHTIFFSIIIPRLSSMYWIFYLLDEFPQKFSINRYIYD